MIEMYGGGTGWSRDLVNIAEERENGRRYV